MHQRTVMMINYHLSELLKVYQVPLGKPDEMRASSSNNELVTWDER